MARTSRHRHIHPTHVALLTEVSRIMSRPMVSEHKITHVLYLLSLWVDLHYARVLLPNYRNRQLEIAYANGLPGEKIDSGQYTVSFDQGLTGYVWRSGQVALVTNALSEPMFLHRIVEPIDGSMDQIGFISVPIIVDGKAIGVLSVQRTANPRRRYADDIDLLRVIAMMMGPVLQSVHHRARNISQVPGHLDRDSERLIRLCESHGIIGSGRALLSAIREIDQVKDSDAPLLLLGESGTGKEMFAGMAHRESRRRKEPFICINCASIPETLLESELFGHEKGSFTGAFRRQAGKIEQADGGTLFLDEIGDMPLDLQAKLLRVLQDKQIQPIGSERPKRVNFRLITATHVNLVEAVRCGRFRLDLYYRLNVIPVSLPPLRQRREDIPRLAQHFLNHYGELYDRSLHFTQDGFDRLQQFDWPGNIRQLQNVIERAVLKAEGQWLGSEQMDDILRGEMMSVEPRTTDGLRPPPEANMPIAASGMDRRTYSWVQDSDRDAIAAALEKSGGNQTRAAMMLGMTPRQLRYRLKKLQGASDDCRDR